MRTGQSCSGCVSCLSKLSDGQSRAFREFLASYSRRRDAAKQNPLPELHELVHVDLGEAVGGDRTTIRDNRVSRSAEPIAPPLFADLSDACTASKFDAVIVTRRSDGTVVVERPVGSGPQRAWVRYVGVTLASIKRISVRLSRAERLAFVTRYFLLDGLTGFNILMRDFLQQWRNARTGEGALGALVLRLPTQVHLLKRVVTYVGASRKMPAERLVPCAPLSGAPGARAPAAASRAPLPPPSPLTKRGPETGQPLAGNAICVIWNDGFADVEYQIVVCGSGGALAAIGFEADGSAFVTDFDPAVDEWWWPCGFPAGPDQRAIRVTPAATDLGGCFLAGQRTLADARGETALLTARNLSLDSKALLIAKINLELKTAFTTDHVAKIKSNINAKKRKTTAARAAPPAATVTP